MNTKNFSSPFVEKKLGESLKQSLGQVQREQVGFKKKSKLVLFHFLTLNLKLKPKVEGGGNHLDD